MVATTIFHHTRAKTALIMHKGQIAGRNLAINKAGYQFAVDRAPGSGET